MLFLSAEQVRELLPPPRARVTLAGEIYEAMAAGLVDLPPKPGLHPREDSFIHAMPVHLVAQDVVAVKWVGGSTLNRGRGLPYISGLIIVNDPETAEPIAIMDAAEITAARTAAASVLCIERFAPPEWRKLALIGFGAQGRAHARLLEQLHPDVEIAVYDPSATGTGDNANVTIVDDARAAVTDASVVVTAVPLARHPQPFVLEEWLGENCLLVPLDFDAAIERQAIEASELLVVDDVAQFEYYRGLEYFADWPVPHASVGESLRNDERPARVTCCNLGVASLDAAFAAAVLTKAGAEGVGLLLTL